VVDAIARSTPLLVLGGGDYAYADRDRRFRDPADAIGAWFEQMRPLLSAAAFMGRLGNHETGLGERIADWSPRMPGRTSAGSGLSRSFDVGAVHFMGLHAPGLAPCPADLDWLEADLRSERARAAAWRIVYQDALGQRRVVAAPRGSGRDRRRDPCGTRVTVRRAASANLAT